jgi:hypothetical protein
MEWWHQGGVGHFKILLLLRIIYFGKPLSDDPVCGKSLTMAF